MLLVSGTLHKPVTEQETKGSGRALERRTRTGARGDRGSWRGSDSIRGRGPIFTAGRTPKSPGLLGEVLQKSFTVPGDNLKIELGAAGRSQKVVETQLGLGLPLGMPLLVVSLEGGLTLLEAQCPSPWRWAGDR